MSTPPFDPDDPRLTAYALGEADENDRRAIEEWLAESAEARAEVEQTRGLALILTSEYARENARYVASRPDDARPANLIPFSLARTRRWPRATASILQAAAVLALTASLAYLGLRKPHSAMTDAVAATSLRPPPAAPAPAPAAAEPLSQAAKVDGAVNEEPAGSTRVTALHSSRDTMAAAPGTNPEPSPTTDDKRELASAGGQVARATAMAPAAAVPSMRRAAPAMLPEVVKAFDKPVPSDEQIARSVVRVRCADGKYFGGVIVSSDGLILAATTLPDLAVRQTCTVLLPDRSEASAVPEGSRLGAGWYWLRIKARGLPAASLAVTSPADGATLTIPVVNRASGNLTLSRVRPDSFDAKENRDQDQSARTVASADREALAFDPAAGLLVFEPPTLQSPPLSQAKAAVSRPAEAASVVRPFNAAERAILDKAIETGEPQ